MKIRLNELRLLFTAAMAGVPTGSLYSLCTAFRDLDFTVVTTEETSPVNGRLIAIKGYTVGSEEVPAEFLFEAWYQESKPGVFGGGIYPFDKMIRNRSFTKEDLIQFGDFYVFTRGDHFALTEMAGPWQPPVRAVPQQSMPHAFGAVYGNGPGSPYYQQPGIFHQPGFLNPQHNPQQPSFNPDQHRFNPTYATNRTGQLSSEQLSKDAVRNKRTAVVNMWIRTHMLPELNEVTSLVHSVITGKLSVSTMRHPFGDLRASCLGVVKEIQAVYREDLSVLDTYLKEAYEDTGIDVYLEWNEGNTAIVVTIILI